MQPQSACMQCNFLFVLLVCFWFCCLCFVCYTQGVDAYLLWHCFRNSLDSVVLYQSNLCWPRFYGQHMIKILFYPIAFSLFFLASFIEDGVEKVQSQWHTPEESGEKLKQTRLLKMWGWPLYPPPRAQRMSPCRRLCFPVSPRCVFLTFLSRLVYWECTGFSQSVCFDSSLMLLWLL